MSRRLYWLASGLAAVALVAGSAVAVTSYLREDDPAQVVRGYFAAVARGDAPAALGYGDLPSTTTRLVSRDVLQVQRTLAPISGLTVTGVRRSDNGGGVRNLAAVDVRYQLGFRSGSVTVTDSVDVRRHGRTWRLGRSAVPVQLTMVQAQNRATLAGGAVPRSPVLLFPGALPITFDTANLALAPTSRAVRFASDTLSVVPVVTDPARAAAGRALAAALARCLRGSGPSDPSCPTPDDSRAVPGSLHGMTLTPVSDGLTVSVSDGADGLLDVSTWVRVQGRFAKLDFDNQQVASTYDERIRVSAHCYATQPGVIAWDNS